MLALDQLGDEIEGREFRDLALDGEQVTGRTFIDCVLGACTLREAALRACRFRGCLFRDCDLSLVRVPGSSFQSTRFERSKLIGIDWSQASWPKGKPLFPSINFLECAISYSTFTGLRLGGIRIVRCQAREVDFSDADLSGADLRDTDFEASRFANTNLSGADLTGATGYFINPTSNRLKGARFALPEALSLLHALEIILAD